MLIEKISRYFIPRPLHFQQFRFLDIHWEGGRITPYTCDCESTTYLLTTHI